MRFPSPEYDDTTAAICHGTASDAQLTELHVLLRSSAAARDEYLWQVELHSRLLSNNSLGLLNANRENGDRQSGPISLSAATPKERSRRRWLPPRF